MRARERKRSHGPRRSPRSASRSSAWPPSASWSTPCSLLEPLERELVVRRDFDGLPPREICTRLGLTSAAARSRPSRALARLRERLDRSFEGGRRAWMAMLVPVGAPAGGHAALEPALLAPLVLGGLALTAVSLVVVLKATRSSDDPETTASPARAAAVLSNDAPAEDSRSSGAAAPAESPRERVAVATEAAPSGTAPAAAHEASWTLVARFVDETGAALVGVRLSRRARSASRRARSASRSPGPIREARSTAADSAGTSSRSRPAGTGSPRGAGT